MAAVVLENLTKKFGDTVAVDAINLDIRDQELTVLVGPSGCGKTTTLRMIAGLEDVTSGEITIGGRPVNRVAPKDRDIAMVFQNYALYPHMNVYKNMAFGLKMRRIASQEIDRRVREAAALLGIEELLKRKPAQLSGGQRQRVAVGRAIVRDPAVFLFDEPLSNLDAKLRVVMRTELVKLQQRLETTTIHVTHDQVEAMTMGNRIVIMNAGSIQQVGAPMDVYDRPANRFVAEFIGSPPMNFIDGVVTRTDDRLDIDCGAIQLAVPPATRESLAKYVGRKVTVGARPEDVSDRQPLDEDSSWSTFDAQILVVQALGAETILELQAGQQSIAARVDPKSRYDRDQSLKVFIHVAKCHFFDQETGNAIQ